MGTPEFACKPLIALQESNHEVLAVVTGMSKRRGRRGIECSTDVCCAAEDLGLPVYTPKTLKSKKLHEQMQALKPDIFVVVAFRILPESLYSLPKYGSINIHGSLLPKYRGAAPINWALINGDKETGLTSFILNKKVDTGSIILQTKTNIDSEENFDSLYARLSEMSGPFLLESLKLLEKPDFKPMAQSDMVATPAPKLTPFDAMIDFGFPAWRVKDFVRGMSTRPGAYTLFRGSKVKVLRCGVIDGQSADYPPGTIIPDKKRLLVQCAHSAVEILNLVPQGKKPMDGRSFLNGCKPVPEEKFGEL